MKIGKLAGQVAVVTGGLEGNRALRQLDGRTMTK